MTMSRRPGEMHTVSGCLRALLLLLLCPLLTRALYVRDDSAAAHKMPAHKTYYIGNTNLRNMKLVNERAFDSYFRIPRATPQAYAAAARRDRSSPRDALTEPPPSPRHRHSAESPRGDNAKTTPALHPNTNREHEELFKPSRTEYFRGHSVYEKHAGTGRRRPHRAQNFHQNMYLSQQVRGRILHSAPAPARLADASQTVVDKAVHSAKEYRKRNTIGKETISQRIDELNDNQLHSPGYMRAGHAGQVGQVGHAGQSEAALLYRARWEHEASAPDSRASLEEAAEGAYYRGGASNYVHLNTGRQHAPLL